MAWAPLSRRLHAKLSDGQEVLAHGRVDLYPQQGVYQLYVDEVLPVGTGLAYLEYARVRELLSAEGLFDEERKRPLPRYPRRVGVVTSAFGAARRDIENVIGQRWPSVEVVLAGALVQGDGAPSSIIAALAMVAAEGVDVIILGRGGGDPEALACFNDELVARAIAAMPVPVVTGIGHETDFTICDFVADLRAPTPSAAAMAVAPDRLEVGVHIHSLTGRLRQATEEGVRGSRTELGQYSRLLRRSSPEHLLHSRHQATDEGAAGLLRETARLTQRRQDEWQGLSVRLRSSAPRLSPQRQKLALMSLRLGQAARESAARPRTELARLEGQLAPLSPEATLRRGYAIVHRGDFGGPIVVDVGALAPGDLIGVRLGHGRATATITGSLPEESAKEIIIDAE